MDSKKSDLLMRYQEYAEFQFAMDGEGLGLRSARQALAERGTASQTGKLHAGTYPAELLPPHVQAMYRQGQRQAA